MILADTSVWIAHFRKADQDLAQALEAGTVAVHPFILGELACGNLRRRAEVLAHLRRLPEVAAVSDAEAMHLLESRRLMGTGLGWVDVHLLASALVAGVRLRTRDGPLARAAAQLGLAPSG